MAINRISGNILQDNLQRGANLAVQGNLIYFDISNDRVGILTSSPQEDFDVDGNLRVGNVTIFEAGNVDVGNVWINNLQDPVANSDAATKYYVDNASSNVNITISDGANTQQVFNGSTITFLAVANQTAISVTATDNVTVGLADSITINQDLTVQGNISGDNLSVNLAIDSDSVTVQGNISGNNLTITNSIGATDITALGNIAATGNITANEITANTAVISSADIGNLDADEVNVTGNTNVTGDIYANNAVITNEITGATLLISGNIIANNIAANETIEGSQAIFFGNVTGETFLGNIEGNYATFTGNVSVDTLLGNIEGITGEFTGNVTANFFLGNVKGATGEFTGNVSGDTFLGNVKGATGEFTGNVSVDTLLGNIEGATGEFTGNVTANFFLGNIEGATGEFTGNVSGDTFLGNVKGATGDFTGNVAGETFLGNVEGDYATFTGDVFANNALANGTIAANLLSSVMITASGNIVYDGAVIGNLILGNLGLVIQSQGDQDIQLDPGLGLVEINTTTGLVIPVGDTTERPGNAVTGTVRYNTDTERVEIYDGTEWDQVLSDVSAQIITPDGSTAAYALDRDSTDPATLVAINGVIQLPSVAYSVTGNIITFAEPPLTTDIIDIRFL